MVKAKQIARFVADFLIPVAAIAFFYKLALTLFDEHSIASATVSAHPIPAALVIHSLVLST